MNSQPDKPKVPRFLSSTPHCPGPLRREVEATARRGPRPDEVLKWKRMKRAEEALELKYRIETA